MRATLGLGRWFGIPVAANIGVLVIILLIGSGLAFGVLPTQFPGWATPTYLLVGLVAGLLLVLSIVVHELAHALVARAKGVQIDGITLWLLGGVAQMRSEPTSPRDELQISAVGPLASLTLGLVFGLLAGAIALAGPAGAPVLATFGFVAWANVLLAVFNLLPAAPLDGGRVLRAALWWGTGDRGRAATIAARAGRGLGLVLIGVGLAQALFLPGIGGLWLALIGLFMVHAATAEGNQARLTTQLHGVRVHQVMSSTLVTAPPRATVAEFIDEVALHRPFSTYPLVDEHGRLTGLVTLNRIRAVPADQRTRTPLEQVACAPEDVPTTRPHEEVTELLPRLHGCGDGRAVVLDEAGRVVAVVSPGDISRLASAADLRSTDPYPPRGADLNRGP
ncbi:site-2 protease family protein [Halostreptopolyspora alba]|uniref:Zinc metalloprotease n=2 Tax=Halostreptopolyspora alba TaxID=2487137 RepID=A0A3N0EEH8_9ACTN|nr:site-2 protease family protein [Nocardiopsaceae bacterium YIM 96095]